MPLPDPIAAFIDAQAERSPVSYEDLCVVVFNGTTKRSPEPSHTDGLLAIPRRIFSVLGAWSSSGTTPSGGSQPRGVGVGAKSNPHQTARRQSRQKADPSLPRFRSWRSAMLVW